MNTLSVRLVLLHTYVPGPVVRSRHVLWGREPPGTGLVLQPGLHIRELLCHFNLDPVFYQLTSWWIVVAENVLLFRVVSRISISRHCND